MIQCPTSQKFGAYGQMAKVAFFVDHDIVFRHFIENKSIVFDNSNFEVRYFFPKKPNKRFSICDDEINSLNLKSTYITVSSERVLNWRHLFYKNQIINFLFKGDLRLLHALYLAVGYKALLKFLALSLPVVSQLHDHFTKWKLRKRLSSLYAELLTFDPDLVVHPTVLEGYFVNDLLMLRSRTNTPVWFFMNSWDNPSTKRAVIGLPDKLFVWGEQTKNHAVKYMGMPANQIVIFGAAQFDVYKNSSIVGRKVGGKHKSVIQILYAGSSRGSDEFSHLLAIDRVLSSVPTKVECIYRPHPWGNGGVQGWRIKQFKFQNIVIDPSMVDYVEKLDSEGNLGITRPDYLDTARILHCVDAVLSPLSTILLEAQMLGKPVGAILYKDEKVVAKNAVRFAAGHPHFDEFLKVDEVVKFEKIDNLERDLIKVLNLIEDESYVSSAKAASKFFCPQFDTSFRDRINYEILKVVRECDG